ncbi:class I SAM-dependent methyltransferase [Nocardioides sp.]|uniref:class I SAM-dependent methyltransferase n=1 Tax=Nocardioides sp. TaxID=35761 RepID=UPI002715D1F4|nr:class I SAM-dependent methyltransferase [Nocardioides sp.]MDO9457461.1 class I SAM-dependent methyltransferase [Nocardioides sp.]
MRRHDLLAELHRLLVPRNYLEIGVNVGGSLTLSRTRSIGIDPYYTLDREIRCDAHLVRTSSDEFFAREHPLAHFDEPVIDLAFIDGMHLAEYAFRDFVNVERFTHPGTVIVIDDMLPRDVPEARRDRSVPSGRSAWAGDVYKVLDTLREKRPDLVCLEVDTAPTGVVVVINPDPASTVLLEASDDIVESYVVPDPQHVPAEIMDRRRAHPPRELLDLPVWGELASARDLPAADARAKVEQAVAGLR